MKHTTAVLAAVLLAALVAVGLAVVEPESADAATSVRSCTGATVKLKVIEKRMLKLHNRAPTGACGVSVSIRNCRGPPAPTPEI